MAESHVKPSIRKRTAQGTRTPRGFPWEFPWWAPLACHHALLERECGPQLQAWREALRIHRRQNNNARMDLRKALEVALRNLQEALDIAVA